MKIGEEKTGVITIERSRGISAGQRTGQVRTEVKQAIPGKF
jgi:hypothetical protein